MLTNLINADTVANWVRRMRDDNHPPASTASGKFLETNPLAE